MKQSASIGQKLVQEVAAPYCPKYTHFLAHAPRKAWETMKLCACLKPKCTCMARWGLQIIVHSEGHGEGGWASVSLAQGVTHCPYWQDAPTYGTVSQGLCPYGREYHASAVLAVSPPVWLTHDTSTDSGQWRKPDPRIINGTLDTYKNWNLLTQFFTKK